MRFGPSCETYRLALWSTISSTSISIQPVTRSSVECQVLLLFKDDAVWKGRLSGQVPDEDRTSFDGRSQDALFALMCSVKSVGDGEQQRLSGEQEGERCMYVGHGTSS
jgi:hypothetical protein